VGLERMGPAGYIDLRLDLYDENVWLVKFMFSYERESLTGFIMSWGLKLDRIVSGKGWYSCIGYCLKSYWSYWW